MQKNKNSANSFLLFFYALAVLSFLLGAYLLTIGPSEGLAAFAVFPLQLFWLALFIGTFLFGILAMCLSLEYGGKLFLPLSVIALFAFSGIYTGYQVFK